MHQYVIRRLFLNIPVVIAALTLVFLATRLSGDYAYQQMGQQVQGGGASLEESIRQVKKELGTDRPLYVQYVDYMTDIVRGDFGESFTTKRPVLTEIKERIGPSIELGILQILVALALALPIGIISAMRQDTWIDYVLRFVAISGLSYPVFFTGSLALLVVWRVAGWAPPITNYAGPLEDPVRNFQFMILPALIGGFATSAGIMRLLRSQMLEVLRQDYVRTAWSKGLHERTVVVRHVLKNALIPVVTVVGLLLGTVVSGNVILETLFSIPGIGSYAVYSIRNFDYPVAQGIVVVFAVALVFVNLVVDLTYAWLDPRIRYS